MCGKVAENEDKTDSSEFDKFVENLDRLIERLDAEDFADEIVREFRNPANLGKMTNANGIGIADGICGDSMEIFVKVDGDVITKCSFFTDGCGATIACGSMLTRLVTGMTVNDASKILPEELDSRLGGLPKEHKHCAALSILALRNALRNYRKKIDEKAKGKRMKK